MPRVLPACLIGSAVFAANSASLADTVSGPDVTVSGIGLASNGVANDFLYYGMYVPPGSSADDTIRAFIMGVTGCNLGSEASEWNPAHSGVSNGKHPVMVQNIYRLLDGRFEHVGMSWARHFTTCAVSEPTCGICQPTSCATLGIGCASTSWVALNGAHFSLGTHAEINPWPAVGTSTHSTQTFPPATGEDAVVSGRLQLTDGVINETNAGGGRFFAEILFVTHDEPFENRYNNASWREVAITPTSMTSLESGWPSVHTGRAAPFAWQHADPAVTVTPIDVPADGRLYLAHKVSDNGDGTWEYVYALYNMNSDRCGASFTVPRPRGVMVVDVGFHDVSYHSGDGLNGEDYDPADWFAQTRGGQVTWFTESFASNANANALRWGTMYNFRFTAGAPPTLGEATIGLFKPGTPDAVTVITSVPGVNTCTGDTDGDGSVSVTDLVNVILDWGTSGVDHLGDVDGSGFVDIQDLLTLILNWGPCGA